YMAPEQRTGGGVDGRTDQYAWGIVACEMFCGGHPHLIDFEQALRDAEADGLPKVLTEVIARALCGRPDDRWRSMREILVLLAPLARSAPVLAVSESAHPAGSSILAQDTDIDASSGTAQTTSGTALDVSQRRRKTRLLYAATALFAVIGAIAAAPLLGGG